MWLLMIKRFDAIAGHAMCSVSPVYGEFIGARKKMFA